jgi:hypothetical protein
VSAIDLNAWHHAIHEVTGDMALRFNKATGDDLKRWVRMLRAVADEMACWRDESGELSEPKT